MKLAEVINTILAIDALKETELDGKTAYALFITKKALLPHYEFYCEEEQKLINKYAKRDENGRIVSDGETIQFVSTEATKEFAAKRKELFNMEVDIEFKRYKIMLPKTIKLVLLEALSSFFDFDITGIEDENDNSRTESQQI